MELGTVLSGLSLIVAVAALLFSVIQGSRAVRIAQHSNELPVASTISSEMRSAEFRHHLDIVHSYEKGGPLGTRFELLDDSLRESAWVVCAFFEHLGVLIEHGIISDSLVLGMMSTTAMRSWRTLKPAIEAERRYRKEFYPSDVDSTFLPNFECLATRASQRWEARRITGQGVQTP